MLSKVCVCCHIPFTWICCTFRFKALYLDFPIGFSSLLRRSIFVQWQRVRAFRLLTIVICTTVNISPSATSEIHSGLKPSLLSLLRTADVLRFNVIAISPIGTDYFIKINETIVIFFCPRCALQLCRHIFIIKDRIRIIHDKMLRSDIINNHLISSIIAHSIFYRNSIFYADLC